MNVKKSNASGLRASGRRAEICAELWPHIDASHLWHRKTSVGWVTIPRGLFLVCQIVDRLSLNKPVSSTYLDLWGQVHDESLVQIRSPQERAFCAGFGGPRAVYTWSQRMKSLERMKLITSKPGATGPFHNVLLLNPYKAIKALQGSTRSGFPKDYYTTLVDRITEIGAKDLRSTT